MSPEDLNDVLVDNDLANKDEDEFRLKANRGRDHLINALQCNAYHFHNIQKIDPIPEIVEDDLLYMYILTIYGLKKYPQWGEGV